MAGLDPNDLKNALELMFELLKQMGVIPKNANKKEVVDNVVDFMKATGLDSNMKSSDLKSPDVKNTLFTALTITAVAGKGAGAQNLLMLALQPERNPEQNAKLTLGLACVNVMQKNPQLKLNLDLIFKNPKEMNEKEKKELHETLTLVFVASNEKEIDLKLGIKPEAAQAVSAAVDAVMNELENPGSTASMIQSGALQKADMERNLFGGGQGPIAANALGVPDSFPALSANSPIHLLSGSILSPMQAASGLLTSAESRDVAMDSGDINAEEADLGAKYELGESDAPQGDYSSEAGDALDSLSSLIAETASDEPESSAAVDVGDIKLDSVENLHSALDKAMDDHNIKTHDSPRPKPPGTSSSPSPG